MEQRTLGSQGLVVSAQGLGWGLGPILGSAVVALGGMPTLYLIAAVLMFMLVFVQSSPPERSASAIAPASRSRASAGPRLPWWWR